MPSHQEREEALAMPMSLDHSSALSTGEKYAFLAVHLIEGDLISVHGIPSVITSIVRQYRDDKVTVTATGFGNTNIVTYSCMDMVSVYHLGGCNV